MTNNEKWKDIQEILLRAQCTDDKEFKAVTTGCLPNPA